jgi:hypothetical protein
VELGYIIGPLIGVGATVVGVTLTGRRDDRIRKEEREASGQTELRQAMRVYLAAVDTLTAEMSSDLVKPPLTQVDRWILRVGQATGFDFLATIVGRLLQRAMFGDRPHQLLDRLADVSATLRLIAPPAVEAYMIEAETLGQGYAPQNERWMKEWRELRARMRTGFLEVLDRD